MRDIAMIVGEKGRQQAHGQEQQEPRPQIAPQTRHESALDEQTDQQEQQQDQGEQPVDLDAFQRARDIAKIPEWNQENDRIKADLRTLTDGE